MNAYYISLVFIEYCKNDCTLDRLFWLTETLKKLELSEPCSMMVRSNVLAVLEKDEEERIGQEQKVRALESSVQKLMSHPGCRYQIRYADYPIPENDVERWITEEIYSYEHQTENTASVTRLNVPIRPGIQWKEDHHDYRTMTEQIRHYLDIGDPERLKVFILNLYRRYHESEYGDMSRGKITATILQFLLQHLEMEPWKQEKLMYCFENLSIGQTWYLFSKYQMEQIIASKTTEAALKKQMSFMEKVHVYIDADISNPDLDLKTAADRFGLTPNYFSAIFTEKMQINFLNYLKEKRMDLAYHLLKQANPGSTIEKTAAMCGYQNVGSFRRNFKAFFGKNPGDIMNEL